MKKLILALFCGAVLVGCQNVGAETGKAASACTAQATVATRTEKIRAKLASGDRNYVFVAMHRGDWRNYPENSRGAIESCIKLGADIVELDAHMTKDGHFVLNHDGSLDRTTNGKGRISDHTLAEIKQLKLRAGQGGKNAPLTEYNVLSLEEALEITRGKVLINIDKFTKHPKEILDAVAKVGCLKEVLVKATMTIDDAKRLFGDYWKNVESGELLYMPVIQWCWNNDAKADKFLPGFLAAEPRTNSMYEICFDKPEKVEKMKGVLNAPGKPRVWINTMWDSLAAGRGEAKNASGKGLRIDKPDEVWGWAIQQGATMIQSDYGKECLEYLSKQGRHNLEK